MKKILVVDDAVTVRMYHRMLLEEEGYSVDEAENGQEALEKSMQDEFDLLLVDVNMPVMDGYEFLQEVRLNASLRHIPAIMISTEAEAQDRYRALEAGGNDYIVKPAKPDLFRQRVRLITGGVQ